MHCLGALTKNYLFLERRYVGEHMSLIIGRRVTGKLTGKTEVETYLRVEKHTASLNTGHKKALWVMPERLAYSVVVSMFDRLFM